MRWRMAVAAVAVGIAVVASACSDSDDDNGAAAVFSFETDDLCEWVSEAEVAEFMDAEFDWELVRTDGSDGVVRADDAGLWQDFDGNPHDLDARLASEDVVEHPGLLEIGAWVIGHPALSDGVVVHNGGFGQFAFGVPPDTEWLSLSTALPGSINWDEDYEARYFSVADRFVEELGWLSEQG